MKEYYVQHKHHNIKCIATTTIIIITLATAYNYYHTLKRRILFFTYDTGIQECLEYLFFFLVGKGRKGEKHDKPAKLRTLNRTKEGNDPNYIFQ